MNGRTGRMVKVIALYILVGPMFLIFTLGYCIYLGFEFKREFGYFDWVSVFKGVGFDGLRSIHRAYMTYVVSGSDEFVKHIVDTLMEETE